MPGLESLAARVEWLRAHVVAEVDGRGLPAELGAANARAWFAALTRAHPGAASRTVGLALALPRYAPQRMRRWRLGGCRGRRPG